MLARSAADDVAAIFIDGLGRFGLPQADRYHDSLEATFAFLGDRPRAARVREDINPSIRAYPFRSHIIIYEIDGDETVVILRVRHAHENWTADPLGDGNA